MPNRLTLYPETITLSELQKQIRDDESLGFELFSLNLAIHNNVDSNFGLFRDVESAPADISLQEFNLAADLPGQKNAVDDLKRRGANIVSEAVLTLEGQPRYVVAFRGSVVNPAAPPAVTRYIVSGADWLNVRQGPSTKDEIVREIPLATIVNGKSLSPDKAWAEIEFLEDGTLLTGWASLKYLKVHSPLTPPRPVVFSNSRFNKERREDYVDSILKNADALNFLKPSRQAWSSGVWRHGYEDKDKFFMVGVGWAASQNRGILEVVEPTRELSESQFNSIFSRPEVSTYCNFNVSYCYQQVYGGRNLQDTNGTSVGGERSANGLYSLLGSSSEWHTLSAADAARIANAGGFVIVAWKNPSGPGHVMFLLDGSSEDGKPSGLRCFHVGSGEPRITTVGKIFPKNPKLLFATDRATYAEWLGIDTGTVFSGPAASADFTIESNLKTRVSPLTARSVDDYFASRPANQQHLKGIGDAIIAASKKYQINATYIVAHAIHETDWGRSSIYRNKKNLFGWNAVDASPGASAKKFASDADCIDFVMGRINTLYLNPRGKYFSRSACLGDKSFGMNVHYASDAKWGVKIANIAQQIERSI